MDYKLKEYFAFNKRERVGVLVLLPIIVLIISFPWLLPRRPPPAIDYTRLQQTQQRMEQLKGRNNSKVEEVSGNDNAWNGNVQNVNAWSTAGKVHSVPVLFPFDPNTLPEEEWKKLGVPEKVARTAQRYLAKGGRFRKPNDLGKIYGMPEQVLKRLLPYVRISFEGKEKYEQSYSKSPTTFSGNEPSALPLKEKPALRNAHATFARAAPPSCYKRTIAPIDINNSDTSAWIALPGIGSKLANRIIHYRESLGGFHSIDQVAEIYGLRDSVFQQLRPHLHCATPSLRKININTEGIEELKQHPYVRWQLASLIVQYRKQHGAYKASEELAHLALVTPELLKKLLPYLVTGD